MFPRKLVKPDRMLVINVKDTATKIFNSDSGENKNEIKLTLPPNI